MKVHVLPVIHYDTVEQAVHNADLVAKAGCPGMFLISMDHRDDELDQALVIVKGRHPTLRIGANFLTQGPLAALERSLLLGLDATWADFAGVSSLGASSEAHSIAQVLKDNPDHQFFGGVSFKGQRPEKLPGQAAVAAYTANMVPTTSGAGTGRTADPSKLATMRQALDEFTSMYGGTRAALGLASGITPENAHQYFGTTTHFLVASGICVPGDFYNFSPELLTSLMDSVRTYNESLTEATA